MEVSPLSPKQCRFYIVRHGQSEGNAQGVLQGQADYMLTPDGEVKAGELAKTFADIKFDEVWSSDLLRTHRTAEILCTERELAVKTTQLLREKTFGQYDGRKMAEFATELKDLLDRHEKLTHAERFKDRVIDGMESDEDVVTRMITFLRETATANPGKTILVVSHGGIMRSFLIHLGFGSYDKLHPGVIRNLGYFVLDSDGTDFFIRETVGIDQEWDHE